MNKRYFWKVLRTYIETGEKLYSGGIGHETFGGKAHQQYFLNRVNKPRIKDSGMFIFDTLKNAKEFVRSYPSYRKIFKCRVKDVRKLKEMCIFSPNISILQRFWNHKIKSYSKRHTPRGTHICSELELVKRVYSY